MAANKQPALSSSSLLTPEFIVNLENDEHFRRAIAFRLGLMLPESVEEVDSLLSELHISHDPLPEIQYVIRGIIATLMINYFIPVNGGKTTNATVLKYSKKAALNKEELVVLGLAGILKWADMRRDVDFYDIEVLDNLCDIMEISDEHYEELDTLVTYLGGFDEKTLQRQFDITKFIDMVRTEFSELSVEPLTLLLSMEEKLEVIFVPLPGTLKLEVDPNIISIYVRNIATRNGICVSGATIQQLICDCLATSFVHKYRFTGRPEHRRTRFPELENIIRFIKCPTNTDKLVTIEHAPIDLKVMFKIFDMEWDHFHRLIVQTYRLIWVYCTKSGRNGVYHAPVSIQSHWTEIDHYFQEAIGCYQIPQVQQTCFTHAEIMA